ncbi:amidohydrolase [Streptomyces sp. SDr-06]|uniref:amidohydrolase n=1 Tax=Streptomyces sp. SDr-06 TaxID=2267702 RepID=UPI0011C06244|nr:amidohydrolase [Streptomyces sp. SDr-06]
MGIGNCTGSEGDDEAQPKVADAVVELVRSVAAAHGRQAEIECLPGYPVTVTDGAETDFLADTVREVFGDGCSTPFRDRSRCSVPPRRGRPRQPASA